MRSAETLPAPFDPTDKKVRLASASFADEKTRTDGQKTADL
jgi:hypothetical protein